MNETDKNSDKKEKIDDATLVLMTKTQIQKQRKTQMKNRL